MLDGIYRCLWAQSIVYTSDTIKYSIMKLTCSCNIVKLGKQLHVVKYSYDIAISVVLINKPLIDWLIDWLIDCYRQKAASFIKWL